MRVRIVGRVQRASHDGTVPHGEYSAAPGPVSDGNRRPDTGMVLTAGRRRWEVQTYDWNRAIASGAIEEIKEGEEMQTTIAPAKICAALVKAQKAFGPALKTSTNPHFNRKYADLGACVEAVIAGLNDNGIALIQTTRECEGGVIVTTNFVHESGEVFSAGELRVPAQKQDPQGYGSALTYARRYSLMTACGIAPEDDDGNAASAKDKKPTQPPPEKPKAAANGDHATEAQRKALFAKGMARWDNRDRVKAFADYLLEAAGAESFTKRYISECLDDFDTRAADFEQA